MTYDDIEMKLGRAVTETLTGGSLSIISADSSNPGQRERLTALGDLLGVLLALTLVRSSDDDGSLETKRRDAVARIEALSNAFRARAVTEADSRPCTTVPAAWQDTIDERQRRADLRPLSSRDTRSPRERDRMSTRKT